jgi:hypothetical protein
MDPARYPRWFLQEQREELSSMSGLPAAGGAL